MTVMASVTFSGQLDADKVFQAIADIIAAREGVKVSVEVHRKGEETREVAG